VSTLIHAFREMDDARHKAELYRAWHTAYRAGFGHERAMAMLTEHGKGSAAERLRQHVASGSAQGQSLTELTRGAGAQRFEPFEAALLQLGDESGSIEQSLRLLADYFASKNRLLQKIKQHLTYPMFTTLAAIVIGPLPLVFQGRANLYWVTVIAGLSAWFGFGGGILVGVARNYANKPEAVRVRLARSLATAVEAGLPLDRAVRLSVEATASPEVTAHVSRYPLRVLATQPLSVTFAGCPSVTPDMLASMHIAEQTGDYTGTLRKLADLYEDGFR
jgi:type II secretory pathway component PulF